jgi:hypothetical protein
MRMFSRVSALTLLAMLGILLVFFCPASSGPFSVTNGPATAFRALAASQALFAAISAALLMATLRCVLRVESLACAMVQVSYDPELFALRC